ncbi:DUF4292 domain-containing protein [Lacinutrix sp. C3R15]|uniref:DUF4292 domain-containing protein n=1 Tax=Flavobacteriaceae TaxID=49546 RepID=UPI001C09AA2C|nr:MULTISPECIES: DUF4292 domain-containing protein [Flavobacteriaceae]MBU2938095.1 DUF4292 domain-containing protein [Lacinutrix sp. C3R15]MDO6621409.1 DUF4292 domain-containing protein [Oceanihabitans sp. 1_MG-2023]
MQTKRLIYTLSFFVFLVMGCKSAKTVTTGNSNLNLSAKQLIKANAKQTPSFKTLAARVKIDYTEGTSSKSTTVSFRMEKDKAIWMSKLGFVKVLITPERVSFYNKLDNTYFDGNYTYLSDLLGTDLDFNKVQNLLLGEALYALKANEFDVSTQENQYVLMPKKQLDAFELFYILDASHFKINSQQLAQATKKRMLQIDYTSYQEVNKQMFPQHIQINAIEGVDETRLQIEFKSITLNEKLKFPFNIPSGYKEIVLK